MKLNFCAACGNRDAESLSHHHLVERVHDGPDDETNLITLCFACHGKLHGRAWRNNHKALTKTGLAAAKARGIRLGGFRGRAGTAEDCAKARTAKTMKAAARAADLAPVISDIRAGGATSLRAIARALDDRGITAPRGGMWSATQVRAAARGSQ